MYQIQLSVRNLVEALYLGGDLVSTSQSMERANLGARIHRQIQSKYGEHYQSEVYLKITSELEDFCFTIDGRADGICIDDDKVLIDEIKTTYVPYDEIDESHFVHFAQAYIYAYIYAIDHDIKELDVQITYYQLEINEVKCFLHHKTFDELESFYFDTLKQYLKWANLKKDVIETSQASLKQLHFPFSDYRKGQRQFAVAVYKTILDKDILFAQAPTGIGKTISTLFPALKAIGEKKCEKIFYLCAKNITASVAYDTISLIYDQGVRFKTVAITAKDKICFLEERNCDPKHCPYAKGYFDRCQDALYELVSQNDFIEKDIVCNVAQDHMVCPFELSLDASLYADVIVCDYNYVFDPRVYLKRFFTEKGNYVFLVDEAHNLVERAREMYSASLYLSNFEDAKKLLPKDRKLVYNGIQNIIRLLKKIRKSCEEEDNFQYYPVLDETLLSTISNFCEHLDAYFQSEHDEQHDDTLKQLYFDCINFGKIADFFDEHFVYYIAVEGKDCMVKQFCMNPVHPISDILKKGRSTIFFSATLSPIDYYLTLLGGDENTKRLSLPSPFDAKNCCCMIANQISTKYARRQASLPALVSMIYASVSMKAGNYIVFAPSYAYMHQIYEAFVKCYPHIKTTLQAQNMSEKMKEEFLSSFDQSDSLHVYFCVIGGMFSEGIDLKQERLIGAIIVGVGLAQINPQQDLIMHHFDEINHMGFSYAYQFPGMNKVLQSAGRVIRSSADKGMILLIDERYTTNRYLSLLPPHYRHFKTVSRPEDAMHILQDFWRST